MGRITARRSNGTRDAVFANRSTPTPRCFAATPRRPRQHLAAVKAGCVAVMVAPRECSCGQQPLFRRARARLGVSLPSLQTAHRQRLQLQRAVWEADVSIEGRAAEFTRAGDEGGRVIYNFCPDCGTTVHYRIDTQPGLIAIPAGAFADPSFPQPFVSVYDESRRCQWVEIGAEPLQKLG